MKNIVLWTLLLGCVAFVASQAVQELPDVKLRTATAAEYAAKPQIICGKQIVNLPNDGARYYTTVFGPSKKVAGWFQTNSTLSDLKRRTHYQEIGTNDPMYARYAKLHHNNGKTVVVLQDPNGKTVYNSYKTGVPASANGLASAIQGDITANCIFRRWRDRRNPEPEPAPEPDGDEEVVDEEEAEAEPVESESDFPFLLVALGLVVGLAAGVGTSYYEQYYSPESA